MAERVRIGALILAMGLFGSTSLQADLYLKDLAWVDEGTLMLSDIVRDSESSIDLGLRVEHPILIPARWVRAALGALDHPVRAVVGSPVAVIPVSTMDPEEAQLYAAVLRLVREVGADHERVTEVRAVAYSWLPQTTRDLELRLDGVSRQDGALRGVLRMSFVADRREGWVETWVGVVEHGPKPQIRSGDSVQLVFRKGAIEVRVPGSATSSGALGERVNAITRIGRKRVSGTVVPGGEVLVGLE